MGGPDRDARMVGWLRWADAYASQLDLSSPGAVAKDVDPSDDELSESER